MRTKNAKRLWPVPATLAFVALAALLAFGLLTTTGTQPAAAHDPAGTAVAPAASDMCHAQVNTGGNDRVGAGSCTTAANSLDVVLQNTAANATQQAIVYVTGGTDHSAQAYEGIGNDKIKAGKKGLAEYLLTGNNAIPEQVTDESKPADERNVPGSKTITINEDMARDGHVFLFVYRQRTDNIPIDDEATELDTGSSSGPDHDPDVVIEVVFLGPAAEYDRKEMTGFNITGIDAIDTSGTTGTVAPMVTVQDENGHMLTGTLTLTIDDPDGKAKFARNGTNSDTFAITNETVDAGTINGLPKGLSAVKMPLMATVTASGATVEFTEYITRVGLAATITSATYLCTDANALKILQDTNESATQNDVTNTNYCVAEARALENDDVKDPSPVAVFSPGSVVLVHSTAVDELEQDVADTVTFTVEEKLDDDEDASFEAAAIALVPVNTDEDQEAVAHNRIHIPTADNIDTGTYDFDVDASDGDGTGSLEITVSGPPMDYEITGDMWIPLGGEKTYTITATDENMNIPAAVAADYMADGDYAITVRVRGTTLKQADDVVGLSTAGMLMVNAGKGTGTFTILAPVEASQGDSATIRVIVNDVVEDTFTVHFGDVPMMPGMPMNVMAEETSHDMITVSWDAVMYATSYMVERGYMDADNMMIWMTVAEMTTDTMYMDSGLMAETTYYYRVTAMNNAGSGDASDSAMATTMMETDEFTADYTVDATSTAGSGMVDVSWTRSEELSLSLVSLIQGDQVVDFTIRLDTSTQFSGVAPGEYDISVFSLRNNDDGKDGEIAFGTVTVE